MTVLTVNNPPAATHAYTRVSPLIKASKSPTADFDWWEEVHAAAVR